MIIRRLRDLDEIVALDGTRLREILNPLHADKVLRLDYSLAHAIVPAGQKSTPHRFFEASEVYYILHGRGVMHIDNESSSVGPGVTVYIPPKSIQWIENTSNEDLEFLCIVCPPWFAESEEIVNED